LDRHAFAVETVPQLPQSDPIRDALGTVHATAGPEARIVSLVPSITELLFDLGLGPQVVGRTHFCVHPAERLAAVPSVGGTKKASLRKVAALKPTHAILNVEENTRDIADALAGVVPHLIVTFPQAPADNVALYRLIGGVFGREDAAETLVARFEAARAALTAAAAAWPARRVLYLIWRDPWMAAGPDTYIARFLALANLTTVPAASGERYPTIALEPPLLAEVDRVLLSSEPYEFGEPDLHDFRARFPAAPPAHLIDGQMTSWYGSRAIPALDYLRTFVNRLLP